MNIYSNVIAITLMRNVNVNVYKNRIISRFTGRILKLNIQFERFICDLLVNIFNFKIRPVNLEVIRFL